MKKSKIFLIAIFSVAAVVVLYFAYGVVKNRYISPGSSNGIKNSETQSKANNQGSNQSDNSATDQSANISESDASDINSSAPAEGRPDVQSANCDNDCNEYKDNADNLKYCQEVCGIRPTQSKDSAGQCESLMGLDKDSCWKDLAVSKKDFSFCEKISDAKLQRVCENRVTEEILN